MTSEAGINRVGALIVVSVTERGDLLTYVIASWQQHHRHSLNETIACWGER
jgi:hypothetical protein